MVLQAEWVCFDRSQLVFEADFFSLVLYVWHATAIFWQLVIVFVSSFLFQAEFLEKM